MIRDLVRPKSVDSPTLTWLPEHEIPLGWHTRCESLSRELHEKAGLLKRSLFNGSERSLSHSGQERISSGSTQGSLFEDL